MKNLLVSALTPFQLRTRDLFILTSVVALEVASLAQASIILFSAFISVSIITLAVVRRRTLLRNLLLAAIACVWLIAFGAAAIRFANSSGG